MKFVKKIIDNNCGDYQKSMLNSLVSFPVFSLRMLCTFDCSAESRSCVIPILESMLQFFVPSNLRTIDPRWNLFYAVLLSIYGHGNCYGKVILQNTIDKRSVMCTEIIVLKYILDPPNKISCQSPTIILEQPKNNFRLA